jgi:glycosyltransferase involved in cell wall biosynthesis
MKIVIDTRYLHHYYEKGGVYNYILNLTKGLASVDQENEYYYFFNFIKNKHNKSFKETINILPNGNFKPKICRIPSKIWLKYNFPVEVLTGRVDVYHGPWDFVPPSIFAKKIVTIHDLAFMKFPESFTNEALQYLNKYVPLSVKRADIVLTISDYSKADIEKHLCVPREKIRVVYNGIDECYRPLSKEGVHQKRLSQYGIHTEYILFVGTIQPNKNLDRLFEAYKNSTVLKDKIKLVIAGQNGWHYEEVYRSVKELGLTDDIIFTGFIKNEDLPHMYNYASLFVMPSLNEGFGLAMVEAMACGVPVIASNTGAIPEVAGSAAILFDPFSVEEMSERMCQVLESSALREDMIKRGLERASLFSWKKTAEETLKIYQDVVHECRGIQK